MTDQSAQNAAAGPVKELTGKIGKYDIIKPLGKGAMGMVYLAHDTILERDVALKVMVSQIADDPELKHRFEREAKAVARMTHPNVVQVFDLGTHTDGSPFIAMELLKGEDLQKALRSPTPMSLDRKVGIMLQVLAGLAHAHQQGIVHRDIKPANVFVSLDGTVKIMDFGVARLTTASMTGTGNIVGTADYMSPEQVKGAKVDGRSDLFSVGCMLYEVMAGRRPFHSDNLMAIFYKITHEEPNFDLIPEGEQYDALMPILQKALAKTLDERYQTAYEFAVDLREYLKNHATGATGEHALEDLVDIEPPPSSGVPAPITDVSGPTLVTAEDDVAGATVGLPSPTRGTRATMPGASAPTVVGGGTAAGRTAARGTAARVAPTVVRPTPTARPVPEPSGPPVLYIAVGGLGVALLVAGGYIAYTHLTKPDVTPPPTVASLPPPPETQPPISMAPTTTLPPPTPAPPPTFTETVGKGAAAMRAAQRAFASGDYSKAIAQAQTALREDPGNANARQIIDQSGKGQQALARVRAAETAINRKDFTLAMSEAQAARDLAPWDPKTTDIVARAQRAQQQAADAAEAARRAQAESQVGGLLAQAEQALQAQKWDEAVALYDQALQLDPQNQRATLGRTSAIAGRAVAQSAATKTPTRSFVSGRTTAQSSETRSSGNLPPGFEETPGVVVKQGTAAAELPGKLSFDVDPAAPKPGQRYSVKVYMLNEGTAPISISQLLVKTTINGKSVSAPIPPMAKDAAPGQRTLLASIGPDNWKEDTSDWGMEVTVRTARGEKYSNSLSWK